MRVYKVASVASSLAQAEINIIVPFCKFLGKRFTIKLIWFSRALHSSVKFAVGLSKKLQCISFKLPTWTKLNKRLHIKAWENNKWHKYLSGFKSQPIFSCFVPVFAKIFLRKQPINIRLDVHICMFVKSTILWARCCHERTQRIMLMLKYIVGTGNNSFRSHAFEIVRH